MQWWGKGIILNKWSIRFSSVMSIWALTEGTEDPAIKKLGVQGIQRVQQSN